MNHSNYFEFDSICIIEQNLSLCILLFTDLFSQNQSRKRKTDEPARGFKKMRLDKKLKKKYHKNDDNQKSHGKRRFEKNEDGKGNFKKNRNGKRFNKNEDSGKPRHGKVFGGKINKFNKGKGREKKTKGKGKNRK